MSSTAVQGRIRVTATAYDNCPICTGKTKDHPAFGITSSGIPATPERTIAVDPQVIPMGTWVYIDGLGVYRAEDTGGAIRGNRIDIFMATHDDALEFGIQQFDVFFLEQTF
ncbi:MAG: 3D domain-containing protein [Clostridia bacterium]